MKEEKDLIMKSKKKTKKTSDPLMDLMKQLMKAVK